jgi:hypothetical protein
VEAVSADKTAQILGEAEFDAAMLADAGIGVAKISKAGVGWAKSLARGERTISEIAEAGGKNPIYGAVGKDYIPNGKVFAQETEVSCVAASCRMLLDDAGIVKSETEVIQHLPMTDTGVGINHVPNALEKLGINEAKFSTGSSIPELETALNSGNKAIVSVKSPGMTHPHAVVIEGIESERFLIRDPYHLDKGIAYSVGKKDFELYAWHEGRMVVVPNK